MECVFPWDIGEVNKILLLPLATGWGEDGIIRNGSNPGDLGCPDLFGVPLASLLGFGGERWERPWIFRIFPGYVTPARLPLRPGCRCWWQTRVGLARDD